MLQIFLLEVFLDDFLGLLLCFFSGPEFLRSFGQVFLRLALPSGKFLEVSNTLGEAGVS